MEYATKSVDMDERIFPIIRQTAWKMIKQVAKKAGLQKRVYPHLMRHSSAIFRLRQTDPLKVSKFFLDIHHS